RRLRALAQRSEVIIAVDHPDSVQEIASIGTGLSVLVDLDVGMGRCGVRSKEAALSLAHAVIESGLRFRGLMGYEGRASEEARQRASERLAACRTYLEKNGIQVEIVSGGGTGSYSIPTKEQALTEIQPGSYAVMDA